MMTTIKATPGAAENNSPPTTAMYRRVVHVMCMFSLGIVAWSGFSLVQTDGKNRLLRGEGLGLEEATHNRDTVACSAARRHTQAVLENLPFRFYMYTDDRLTQKALIEDILHGPRGNDSEGKLAANVKRDADAEILVLQTLENHPMRVYKPKDADLFIVPLSAAAVVTRGKGKGHPLARKRFKEGFEALFENPIWKQTYGHRHLLLGLAAQIYAPHTAKQLEDFGLSQYYPLLENATIAKDFDSFASKELAESNVAPDFTEYFEQVGHPISKSTFSIGLLPAQDIPYIEASYDKWRQSSNFIFYWTKTFFVRESTPIRVAPLDEKVIKGLPKSSIGNNAEYEEWATNFKDSKYCLVIRGDTPHSHALLRSVKVGCIPVVISDTYPTYAPPFKSSLEMQDFTFTISEREFMKNPLKALKKLEQIPEDQIRDKIEALAFVQRVTLPDHPESLFVPSMLREALEAIV
uniref:Exostosin GT47 domain-containing protein n=1 Tax=Grammatophora oceanica TaxID=210454 RepID=A0A6U5KUZ3_9STRA|mmetsp:Transcript_30807/g.45651  ORF Transcript_30807/g.45651 Transcript_30807/m.45651 type:complete len:464 (+) Transcript_30807:126-1517(+)|eukprot:CAMPEP_0194047476 /NCGR_PEP_ID=MMETSP0009_2-20130614/24940_1 /TAXON_ID=210454 /ORGANISM="Grammatophora oceanica, Strain CCMP 410" /LENGTH=463 /DNA_ID=CAMNT_0038693119 /DNA_START=194 /DNA_END=1585 /DNA_ORIENTATION=-